MYEKFGGLVNQKTRKVTFKLFLPDHEKAPFQYEGGGLPRITDVFVVGSFQDPATRQWDLAAPVRMIASDYRDGPSKPVKGVVYSHTTAPLPPAFYEYKYLVHFEDAAPRLVTDPCGRYGGAETQNSGFVVGGRRDTVRAFPAPLPFTALAGAEPTNAAFTA